MGNYIFKVIKMFYDHDKTLGSIYPPRGEVLSPY